MWVLLLCLGLVAAPSTQAAAAGSIQGRKCQPQGLLKLDKPYAQPRRVELPFCKQYGCSCCNASHALTLQRGSRVIAEDEDLSQDCKLGLLRLTCRVCDPQVGVGIKKHICRDTCSSLFDACAQDFFSYDSGSGLVSPCSEQTSGMLVCSQLTDLVSSAAEFCKAAGFGRMAADADEPCFDGTPVSADACPAEESSPPAGSPAQKQRQKQRRRATTTTTSSSRHEASDLMGRLITWLPWKLKRRHKRQLAVAAELLFGLCVSGFMAWVVVALLQRVMQPARRPRPTGPPAANVRDVLARAAEVRSSRAAGKQQ